MTSKNSENAAPKDSRRRIGLISEDTLREIRESARNPTASDRAMARATAGLFAAALVIVLLWAFGVIHDTATVTAAATILLAIGTVALAFGAIGTYVEQRKANTVQQAEITRQEHQLEVAKEIDMAQVVITRRSGPGQLLQVEVANKSTRVIRFVYVWATVRGMSGHYLTAVRQQDSPEGQWRTSRRMQHTRRKMDDGIIEWCYRSLQTGTSAVFDQFELTNPEAIPDVADEWIVAYAMFIDHEGAWWKCTEDDSVEKLPGEPPIVVEQRPVMGRGLG